MLLRGSLLQGRLLLLWMSWRHGLRISGRSHCRGRYGRSRLQGRKKTIWLLRRLLLLWRPFLLRRSLALHRSITLEYLLALRWSLSPWRHLLRRSSLARIKPRLVLWWSVHGRTFLRRSVHCRPFIRTSICLFGFRCSGEKRRAISGIVLWLCLLLRRAPPKGRRRGLLIGHSPARRRFICCFFFFTFSSRGFFSGVEIWFSGSNLGLGLLCLLLLFHRIFTFGGSLLTCLRRFLHTAIFLFQRLSHILATWRGRSFFLVRYRPIPSSRAILFIKVIRQTRGRVKILNPSRWQGRLAVRHWSRCCWIVGLLLLLIMGRVVACRRILIAPGRRRPRWLHGLDGQQAGNCGARDLHRLNFDLPSRA